MKSASTTHVLFVVFTLVTLSAQAQVFKGAKSRETLKLQETLKNRETREKEVQQQVHLRQTSLQNEATNQMVGFLSAVSRGQTDSVQLKSGLRQEYMIKLVGQGGNQTRVIKVKVAELAEGLSKESQRLKETNESQLTGNSYNVHNNRRILVESLSKLVGVASKKYSGSDANLVMARDAFARLIETSNKVIDSNSGASARELQEHIRIVNEVVKAKESNDNLTDAEAMLIGADRLHLSVSEQSQKETGLTTSESEASRKQRVQEYLKELKECV